MVYLDAAASTPLAPEAKDAMWAVLDGPPGNPGAAHEAGIRARDVVSAARLQVAELMGVGPAAVLFVAAATEANNLALRGLIDSSSARRRVVTTATEHPSVLATLEVLEVAGAEICVVPVTPSGEPLMTDLAAAIDGRTALVTMHAANNETGVMPDIKAAAELAHASGAWMHTDASQLMAWGPAEQLATCDLVTISSHKMHGPQGAAALIASRRVQSELRPGLAGGGQERGLRSGTENVAAIAGFGAAAELARRSGLQAAVTTTQLRELLLGLLSAGSPVVVQDHGAGSRRLPGILNVGLPSQFEGEAVLAQTPQIAASTGSACSAGTPEPSRVLQAMGLSTDQAAAVMRLSLNRYTTEADVRTAVSALSATLWHMHEASSADAVVVTGGIRTA